MTLEEYNQEIERRTGVPASLLTGTTLEENIAKAKALLAFKGKVEDERPKSTAEQFSDFLRNIEGREEQPSESSQAMQSLADFEKSFQNYPIVKDGGNPYINGAVEKDPRTPAEQFSEFFNQAMRTPSNLTDDGWIRMN